MIPPTFTRLTPWMRRRGGQDDSKVSFLELFFDLVFVFAITQLSHTLLNRFTPGGALEIALLLLAVWVMWVWTAWATNWLNPETLPVRMMLIAMMLLGLLLASAIPKAFGERGLIFALAYVTMQVGRTAFGLWAMWGSAQQANFTRMLAWMCFSAVFWIAGGLNEEARLGLWAAALVTELSSALLGFFVPGLGRSDTRAWDISGEHMAERAGLFIIISLGEGILVAGATFAELPFVTVNIAALAVTFVGSVALWWIYFIANAQAGAQSISNSDDPGRIARSAYTFIHFAIVAGIVLTAVADEFILAHPGGHVETRVLVATLGGPALFLLGNLLFKRNVTGQVPVSHLAGLGGLAALAVLTAFVTPLTLAALTTVVLIGVAVWEGRPVSVAERRVLN